MGLPGAVFIVFYSILGVTRVWERGGFEDVATGMFMFDIKAIENGF